MTNDQLSLLDLPAARAARDEGVARVDSNSDDEWRDAVDAAIRRLAAEPRVVGFTSDDVREMVCGMGVPEPHHDNAWGARFAAAARRGVIRRVGYRQGRRGVEGSGVNAVVTQAEHDRRLNEAKFRVAVLELAEEYGLSPLSFMESLVDLQVGCLANQRRTWRGVG